MRKNEYPIKGLSSRDKLNEAASHKLPEKIRDLLDGEERINILSEWEKIIVNEPIENAIVITKDGEIYRCYGTLNGLYLEDDLGDKLYGAYVTHNHPIGSNNEYSFSGSDIDLYDYYKLELLRGVDEFYIYEMNRNSNYIDAPVSIGESTEYDVRHSKVTSLAHKYGFGYRRVKRGKS